MDTVTKRYAAWFTIITLSAWILVGVILSFFLSIKGMSVYIIVGLPPLILSIRGEWARYKCGKLKQQIAEMTGELNA